MRILLVSDVHAMSSEIEKYKGAYFGPLGGNLRVEDRSALKNPILAIPNALQNYPEKIDLLLCLGDITHQAKQLPLLVAWHDIHNIAEKLDINEVVGIVGNHDVLSRADSIEGVEFLTEFLRQIEPTFPSQDDDFNLRHFADGVAAKEYDDCLLVAVNTCRTHGLGFGKEISEKVYQRGSLTDAMIERVLKKVNSTDASHIVVAMHHHPIPVTISDSEPDDEMANGATLLAALEATNKNILVLHGHKHYVKVQKYGSSIKAPIVFSSASLSALPFTSEQTFFSNQFHVVEFDSTVLSQPMGKITSWDWEANRWQPSSREHMPEIVYFGQEPDLDAIVTSLVSLKLEPYISIESLSLSAPQLKYVTPAQISELNKRLRPTGRKLVVRASKIAGMIYEEESA